MKVFLNQACLMYSKPNAEIYSTEKVFPRGSQASRWESKLQIHLPKGEGLGIFTGRIQGGQRFRGR